MTYKRKNFKKKYLLNLQGRFENDLAQKVLGWNSTKIIQILQILWKTWLQLTFDQIRITFG